MRTWLRLVLLALTIGGGWSGASIAMAFAFHPQAPHLPNVLVALLGLAGFIFILSAGLRFAFRPTDYRFVLAALALQLPYLSSSFVTFRFGAAVPLFFVVGKPDNANSLLYAGFESVLGVNFKLAYGGDHPLRVGLNLTAILLLVLVGVSIRSHKESRSPEQANAPVAQVGP